MIVSFDTETRAHRRDGDEVMTLRCWAAIVRQRGGPDGQDSLQVARNGTVAVDLAELLEAACSIEGEAWCFAHNLGFDLTVTSLPMVLAQRGWHTDFMNMGDESCMFVLSRDGQKLILSDSWSWLRAPLSNAADDVGMRPTRLPGENDGLDDWQRRCAHDAQVLDRLLTQLLDWWDRAGLGSFAITGAACGWRSLRARIAPKTILVGSEPPRTPFERQALYGGRREVWQVGVVRGRWVADFDLFSAYLTTVAHLPLPSKPVRGDRLPGHYNPLAPPPGLGTICDVTVTTEQPCAPVRIGKDVWWPAGTFRTVLSSPDLAAVVQQAHSVTVHHAQWYALDDALAAWGHWCLGLLTGVGVDVPPVARRTAKGWSRSVPGRFALRTSQLIGEGPARHLGWAIQQGTDLDTGAPLETITYGGRERTYRKDQDGADVSPAVLAFIEGYVRAAMARVIASRDPTRMLQCNTDGWWEVCAGPANTHTAPPTPAPFHIVRKAHERGAHVIGPNHMITPGERRLSGVPTSAIEGEDGRYGWRDWPGLRWQIEHSRPGEYLRPRRELALRDHYCRRWVLSTGETVPVTAYVDDRQVTRIRPWQQTSCRYRDDELGEHQVPALAELIYGPGEPSTVARPSADLPLGRRSRPSTGASAP